MGDILNTSAEPTFNLGRAALPAILGDITFEHVTFRYRVDGREVLRDVSFSVPAAPRGRAKAHSPSSPNGCTCRKTGACLSSRSLRQRGREQRTNVWREATSPTP